MLPRYAVTPKNAHGTPMFPQKFFIDLSTGMHLVYIEDWQGCYDLPVCVTRQLTVFRYLCGIPRQQSPQPPDRRLRESKGLPQWQRLSQPSSPKTHRILNLQIAKMIFNRKLQQ